MAKTSVANLVRAFLEEGRPALIMRAELDALRAFVAERLGRPVSDSRLLELLHETDVEIDRALGGLPRDLRDRVRTREPALAADSLIAMAEAYLRASEAGEGLRAGDCRRAVVAGKERLKRSLRNPRLSDAKRREKEELLEWFLQWLEAPSLFCDWLELRRRSRGIRGPGD